MLDMHRCNQYFAVAKYCDEYVCVCVSVRIDISGTTRAIFTKFLCMLPIAVARSSSGDIAIRYVLPVWDDIIFCL